MEQPSSFDEDGMPTVGEPTWSRPIGCFISVNTHNTKGTYQDGRFTQASYEVLLERQPLDVVPSRIKIKRCNDQDLITRYLEYYNRDVAFQDSDSKQMYVIDDSGFEDLGEWEVQNFESVNLDRIKITV